MSAHTEGLLKIRGDVGPCVIGTDEREVAEFYADGEEQTLEDQANARRAVASWNACRGIPTDLLERVPNFAQAGVQTIESVEQERDEVIRIVRDAQRILARHLPPDGISTAAAINELLALLDGPRTRAVVPNEQTERVIA